MKIIKEYVDGIEEELESAQEYAEKMVEFKARMDSKWASRFKAMAEEELTHAMNLHDLAIEEIDKLTKVYQPSQDMLEKWKESHKKYVEKAAWIKQMMSL